MNKVIVAGVGQTVFGKFLHRSVRSLAESPDMNVAISSPVSLAIDVELDRPRGPSIGRIGELILRFLPENV